METSIDTPTLPIIKERSLPDDDTLATEQPSLKPLNLAGSQFAMPTPPDTSPAGSSDHARAASPAPSSSALSSISTTEPKSTNAGVASVIDRTHPTPTGTGPPPAKRRKLTSAEKEEQKHQKEVKEREKAEQKAQREEEKRVKDIERQQKNAERETEKRVKDIERQQKNAERETKKREKELDEERKNQENVKKARSQMRLGVFFQKPPNPVKSPGLISGGDRSDRKLARRKSLSIGPFDAIVNDILKTQSPTKGAPPPAQPEPEATDLKPAVSDYRKYFLPFELGKNSTLWSSAGPHRNDEELEHALGVFDVELNDQSLQEKYNLGIVDSYYCPKRQFAGEQMSTRGAHLFNMRTFVEKLEGNSQVPIDLTGDSHENPLEQLQSVSRRYLHFSHDVRPPYFGSFTKITSPRAAAKLRRNPFARVRTDTDYEYDSEAEWEEPEEGEELVDEQDDEDESVGDADEMDGFLDDEDDALKDKKRRMIGGDLVPVTTGLCWEDEAGRTLESTESVDRLAVLREMKIGLLVLDGLTVKTIDPFSTAYWPMAPPAASKPVAEQTRPPLQDVTSTTNNSQTIIVGAVEGMKGPIKAVGTIQNKPSRKPAPKAMGAEDVADFKDAVQGSNLSKIELCKMLKQRFPRHTNELIKDTLGAHFAHVGAHRNEKKWVWFEAP